MLNQHRPLHAYLADSAASQRDCVAVRERDGSSITYGELDALASKLRDRLLELGVSQGDRVGIYLGKSIDSVASIFGVLKTGAAYVPVDPTAPQARNAYIFGNCRVRAIVIESRFVDGLRALLDEASAPAFVILDKVGGGQGLSGALPELASTSGADAHPDPDQLAYILYTSGSTGRPKGVQITHRNATSFVDWCCDVLRPTGQDRFSSHAPFHFDLSILDIYTPIRSGGQLVLINEETGKNPAELASYIAESGISVWYSAPSILAMLVQYGELATHDVSKLRAVLFAGEVFAITHLKALHNLWPHPRYFNLYGPTETNVCTFFEVPEVVPENRSEPYPIGKVCAHLEARVVDENGRSVAHGEEGELVIHGPSVTQGYWELPEQTEKAYLSIDGKKWYKTGDLVYANSEGDFVFVGRRDRMIKKRGTRVELGEIESCLYQHEQIVEAAVVAVTHPEDGVRVVAHIATKEGDRLSTIKLKQFCAARIPIYMIPDVYQYHNVLPKTSTDKIDYQTLIKLSTDA